MMNSYNTTPTTNLYASKLAKRWWTLVVRGVAALLFGILTIAMPGISLFALVILWGAYAIVDGVFALMIAAWRGSMGLRWGWWVLEGVIGIGAGVVTFLWPGITMLVLLSIIAFWALFTGFIEITAAIFLRRHLRGEWLLALSGLLSIGFGVLLLAFPGPGMVTLVWMIGLYAILFGGLLIGLGLQIKRWLHTRNFPSNEEAA